MSEEIQNSDDRIFQAYIPCDAKYPTRGINV